MNKLSQYKINLINEKLPPKFAALMHRYPDSIFNAADHWDKPNFPHGYVPTYISIYYDEVSPGPSIFWHEGNIRYVKIEDVPINPDVILVDVDNLWVYIRVQGQVILDRTEGIQFPPELTQQELMLKRIMRSIASGNSKDITK